MKRKVVGIALFCLLLLVAIFAGYWDMLNTEQVRLARQKTSDALGGIAAMVDPAKPSDPAPTAPAAVEPAAPQAAPDAETQTASKAPAAEASTPEAPTFDILRVDPDGSTVLAGKAPAGASVRLVDGATTLGEETASAVGEFAIVLDKPLAVGEHQIRIEATGENGTAATSRETAIVSVPQPGRENELLAMVETPNQPSRLISVPKADGASSETLPAAPMAAVEVPSDVLSSPAVAAPSSESTDQAPDGSTPATADQTPPSTGEVPPVGVDAGIAAAPPQATAPAMETAMPGSAAPAAPQMPSPSPGMASDEATEDATASFLAVEAVEIEDRTIYIAGRAPVGRTVRIYVDNVFLGEDANRENDRFLVTTKTDVPPGQHTVRADQLAADGRVLARVEVPFLKPEGNTMSAVAGPPARTQDEPAPAAIASAATAPLGVGEGAATATATPAQDETARSTSSAPETKAPGAAPDAARPAGGTVAEIAPSGASARAAPADITAGPDRAAGETAPLPLASEPPTAGQTTQPSVEGPQISSAEPDAAAGIAPTDKMVPTTANPSGSDVATARQAPLEAVGARVIIRRGDTLWRISRDTYGRGARYTTIYLANGDQIRDPDRIYPGQVFRMPEEHPAKGTPVR